MAEEQVQYGPISWRKRKGRRGKESIITGMVPCLTSHKPGSIRIISERLSLTIPEYSSHCPIGQNLRHVLFNSPLYGTRTDWHTVGLWGISFEWMNRNFKELTCREDWPQGMMQCSALCCSIAFLFENYIELTSIPCSFLEVSRSSTCHYPPCWSFLPLLSSPFSSWTPLIISPTNQRTKKGESHLHCIQDRR